MLPTIKPTILSTVQATMSPGGGETGIKMTATSPSVDAGNNAVITITIPEIAAGDVTVNYQTADGSALAGVNYVAESGVATIIAGQLGTSISIATLNDGTFPGPDLDFTVNYNTASEGYAPPNSSTVTVVPIALAGQVVLTITGAGNWPVPDGVSSVDVVCVGGGGGHSDTQPTEINGGGGLGWKNTIAVTPGGSVPYQVGIGGVANQDGGDTWFSSTTTCRGRGSATRTFDGDGGGNGGAPGNQPGTGLTAGYGGGGGAGGYAGNGGNGGDGGNGDGALGKNGAAGAGGAGGGGAGAQGNAFVQRGGGGGGGVGLLGQGASGAGGLNQTGSTDGLPGGAGSGGSNGQPPIYGGGAKCESFAGDSDGGQGAIRIMWGGGRSYPSNAADV